MAHAYTNETQIMWNGIIGEISLTAKNSLSIDNVQVYPDVSNGKVRIKGTVFNRGEATEGTVTAKIINNKSGFAKNLPKKKWIYLMAKTP